MKKLIKSIVLILIMVPASYGVSNINASDYEDFNSMWDRQEVIPNQQYEETINALEEKKNEKAEKEKKKKLKKFKGSSLHKELDATLEDLPDQTLKDPELEEQIIQFPVDFVIDNKIVEKGYYRVISEKKKDGAYLNFYQAHDLKAKIKVRETDDDFGEKDIMFVRLLPYKDGIMKLIYGSIEMNCYSYMRYIEPKGEFTPQ